jgi:phage terminase small subunit
MPAYTKGRHISTKPRLTPPTTLPEGAVAIFEATVRAVDPDHFSVVDLPLLEQYAVVSDLAQQAQHHVEQNGAVVAGKLNSWMAVQEKSIRAMVALSARLRICPQSRFDRLVAGANSRPQPDGPNRFAGRGKRPVYDDDPDGLLA